MDTWVPWILGYHGYLGTMDTKIMVELSTIIHHA